MSQRLVVSRPDLVARSMVSVHSLVPAGRSSDSIPSGALGVLPSVPPILGRVKAVLQRPRFGFCDQTRSTKRVTHVPIGKSISVTIPDVDGESQSWFQQATEAIALRGLAPLPSVPESRCVSCTSTSQPGAEVWIEICGVERRRIHA